MGIEIQHVASRPDRFGPVFVCEACDRRIYNASEGIYCYGIRGLTIFRLHIFHKGSAKYPACVKAWEDFEKHCEIDGVLHQWEHLERFVIALGNNLEKKDSDQ